MKTPFLCATFFVVVIANVNVIVTVVLSTKMIAIVTTIAAISIAALAIQDGSPRTTPALSPAVPGGVEALVVDVRVPVIAWRVLFQHWRRVASSSYAHARGQTYEARALKSSPFL